MIKKKLKKNLIILGIVLFLVIGFILIIYFGVLQGVLGVNQVLNYKTTFDFNDGQTGTATVEATLDLPIQTQEFTLTPYYNRYTDEGAGSFAIKYEVFNYNTNSWEVFHEKTWSLLSAKTYNSRVKTNGGVIYQNAVASKLFSNKLTASGVKPSVYDKYYACMPGVTIEQAKSLGYIDIPTTQIYNDYCVYPDNNAVDTGNGRTIHYVPTSKTLNTNYINNNQALFRITYNPQTSSMDGAEQDEFKIELWKVITNKPTVWTYNTSSLKCDSSSKYTYELTTLDYYTELECKTANNIPESIPEECGIFNPCEEGECINGVCKEKEPDPNPEPEPKPNWKLIISIISGIVILGFVILILKWRKK